MLASEQCGDAENRLPTATSTTPETWDQLNPMLVRILEASFREGFQDEGKAALRAHLMKQGVMDASARYITTDTLIQSWGVGFGPTCIFMAALGDECGHFDRGGQYETGSCADCFSRRVFSVRLRQNGCISSSSGPILHESCRECDVYIKSGAAESNVRERQASYYCKSTNGKECE